MKIIFLVLTTIIFVNTEPQENQQINSNAVIRQLFEMLKYYIKNGHIENDYSILDPFEFDYKFYDSSLSNKALRLYVGFTDGMLTGVGDFEVQSLRFIENEVAIELCINFPLITFKSEKYEMRGDIYKLIPIAGRGKFEFEVHNLKFTGKVYLKQSDDEKSILIKNILHSQFSVQKIASKVDFDNNIDDIANEIITDLLANYVTRFNQFIVKTYIEHLIDLINPYLNNFDSWRIISPLL